MLHQNTQKNIILTTVLFQFLLWIPGGLAQEEKVETSEKRQFLVTAYYSPKPDQSFYIRGSYDADVKLNGKGTHGADGTEVYVGMIAAPQTYPFGTRISIPGLGVGEVHDRGGAIQPGADFDRIDVWMGYGQEGLSRALNWGSRYVEGEVYFDPSLVEAGFDYSWVNPNLSEATVKTLKSKTVIASQEPKVDSKVEPEMKSTEKKVSVEVKNEVVKNEVPKKIVTPELTKEVLKEMQTWVPPKQELPPLSDLKLPEALPVQKQLAFDEVLLNKKVVQNSAQVAFNELKLNDKGEKVVQLQGKLIEKGYLAAGLNTGFFGPKTVEALVRFQLEKGVIKGGEDPAAGKVGLKTLSALNLS